MKQSLIFLNRNIYDYLNLSLKQNVIMANHITLKTGQSFYDLLLQLQKDKTKAAMLLDCNGLVRAEGIISEARITDTQPYLKLQSRLKIVISTIVAVNGIFLSDYSEC